MIRHLQFSNGSAVGVEIADTIQARAHGLSKRDFMPEDRGMLFLFPDRLVRGFWMRDTRFPLDLIFIDGRVVVGIFRNAAPMSLELRSVAAPSTSVLEVNGGWAARHRVEVGHVALY